MSMKILTSLPITLTTTSITTTSRPIKKGIAIGQSAGGSSLSSKPPLATDDQSKKGKGIEVNPSEEEKKKRRKL